MPATATEIFGDAPDVEWSCVEFHGSPILAIVATGNHVSAALLQREYKTIKIRFIWDNDKLPDFVPQQFICTADGNIMHPILACDPDPMLHPLRVAVTEQEPWYLALQVMVEGKRHMKFFKVNPDWTTEPIPDATGNLLWPRWLVGFRG